MTSTTPLLGGYTPTFGGTQILTLQNLSWPTYTSKHGAIWHNSAMSRWDG